MIMQDHSVITQSSMHYSFLQGGQARKVSQYEESSLS